MKAYRCSTCDINWPFGADYRSCPIHLTPTWEVADGAITWDAAREKVKEHNEQLAYEAAMDAERAKRDEAFEQYYAEREKRRIEEEMERTLEQIRSL